MPYSHVESAYCMSAYWVSQTLQAEWVGKFSDQIEFSSVSTDSRSLQRSALFIALNGCRFDGHDFIEAASKKGAAALIISKKPTGKITIPYLLVNNTEQALADLAMAWRRQFKMLTVIAVTGSCGKTTTKNWIATVLKPIGTTLCAEGSYNNHIGLPLTLLKLRKEHRFAVLELGASSPGEIKILAAIARPSIAVITNIEPAHLEGFGNLQCIADNKGALLSALPKDGIAILNRDALYFTQFKNLLKGRQAYCFGFAKSSDIRATNLISDTKKTVFTLHIPGGLTGRLALPVPGKHQIYNALAVAATTYALDIPQHSIQTGLGRVVQAPQRSVMHHITDTISLIDDSYNASPTAVRAAIDMLVHYHNHYRIMVIGDMRELGNKSKDWHCQIGEWMQQSNIQQVYSYGKMSQHTTSAFGKAGQHFVDLSALIAPLIAKLSQFNATGQKTVICIKGSRSMRMECVVTSIKEAFAT